MPDGTVLRADLYLPQSDGPHPVVLARTPYNKQLTDPARPWLRYAAAGYAVAIAPDELTPESIQKAVRTALEDPT